MRRFRALAFGFAAVLAAARSQGQAPFAPPTANLASQEADLETAAVAPYASELGGRFAQTLAATLRPPPSAVRNAVLPPSPWKTVFYDNDFSDFVGKEPHVIGEELKLMPIDLPGEALDMTLSVGGQLRHRYMYEDDRIRPGGSTHNDYQLWRLRQFYDLRHEYFRVYVETIAADSFGEELPPVASDVNHFDLLNAFIDLNVYNGDYGKGVYRYGRQELVYGKQRLISPLDWTNTRRNFQGHKFFHVGEGWRFDAFAVNPVNAAARGVDFDRLDSQPDDADHRRTFYGAYLTLAGNPMMSADFYMLYQDDERPRANFAEGDRGLNGGRLYGVLPIDGGSRTWDYDVEGGYEWGSDRSRRVTAGFATTDVGHTWKKAAWTPRLAGVFYYGSGGSPENTFYTFYPLGHAFWGFMDNLSGQNLLDFSPQLSLKPARKLNVTGAYHYFMKADGNGFLYNVSQAPVPPAGVGRDIGHETDLVATYTFNPNLSVQGGYCHFWYGRAGRAVTGTNDADFFYMMTTFNY